MDSRMEKQDHFHEPLGEVDDVVQPPCVRELMCQYRVQRLASTAEAINRPGRRTTGRTIPHRNGSSTCGWSSTSGARFRPSLEAITRARLLRLCEASPASSRHSTNGSFAQREETRNDGDAENHAVTMNGRHVARESSRS